MSPCRKLAMTQTDRSQRVQRLIYFIQREVSDPCSVGFGKSFSVLYLARFSKELMCLVAQLKVI